jgi:hypothetical protein
MWNRDSQKKMKKKIHRKFSEIFFGNFFLVKFFLVKFFHELAEQSASNNKYVLGMFHQEKQHGQKVHFIPTSSALYSDDYLCFAIKYYFCHSYVVNE